MSQWYLSYDGDPLGPFDVAQAVAQARKNPDGYAWREGFAEWLPHWSDQRSCTAAKTAV